jgi:hypothetical protein
MTLRPKDRPLVDHRQMAEMLRDYPGVWLVVGAYSSQYSAQFVARMVCTANGKPGGVYTPAGAFDADGEPTLLACYVGTGDA